MIQRLIGKVGRVIAVITRFYLSGTGLLLLLGIALGVVLALTVSPTAGLVSVAFAFGIILPYRLMRLDAARLVTHHSQIAELRGAEQSVRKEVEAMTVRLDQVRRDLLGTVATLREESNALLRSERTIWMDAVANFRGEVDAKARAQSNANHLRFARRDARSFRADRVLLIVAMQRVGSTWLFDLLRQHPAIGMHPAADIFRGLCAVGRRYPAALSNALADGIDVEMQPGVGGLVPFGMADRFRDNDDLLLGPRFVVEKVHPSAIEFDAGGFVDRVEALRGQLGGTANLVQPIYLTREPVESIRSFLSYRRRDPNWHADIPVEFTHDFFRRSYEAIAAIHARLPGPVVTWEQMNVDLVSRMAQLLRSLGVESVDSEAMSVATAMVSATTRPGDSVFFSSGLDKPTASSVELGVGTADPGRAQEAIDRCREIRHRLGRVAVESTPPSVLPH